jgi:ABC-type polysaccharide/polyol phosphate transport system ATPase subunit
MFDLKFAGVSKKYRIREAAEGSPSSNRLLNQWQKLRRRSKEFWAIRDVSFEVERGESLGIIGHNGAGKSTILKLLSNITTPTRGEIQINGSLSALIEVGSGFHPELTGRENVYLNGSILGMRRREISKKLDSIVDFAGIRPFLDLPVKRYSSGMYVRLGFSIAAHLEPDILLLDEVLAVGDLAFQSKCLQRIEDLKDGGTTIVFISHDLGAVQRLCKQALLMQQGEIIASGSAFDVVCEYQRTASDFSPPDLHGQLVTKAAEVTALGFFDRDGKETDCYQTGAPLQAKLEYFAHEAIQDCTFELLFYSGDRKMHCEFSTELSGEQIDVTEGSGTVEFSCPEIGLLPGIVYVDAIIRQRAAPEGSNIDWHYQRVMLRIDPGRMVRGNFYLPHEWHHEQSEIGPCLAAEQAVGNAVSKL